MVLTCEIMKELENRGYTVKEADVSKNGVKHKGITMGDGSVRPTVYIDNYLEEDASRLDEIVTNIILSYEEAMKSCPVIETESIKKWDYAKERLSLCLQRKTDENIAKRDFLDLEEYVRVFVSMDERGIQSFKVHSEHIEWWGVSEQEVFDTAWENTKKKITTEDMVEILSKKGIDISFIPMEGRMIVLSNKERLNGAIAIKATDVLSKLSANHGTDLVVIPSSIHEVIVYPIQIDEMDWTHFTCMICEVNREDVIPEEVLSDHPYIYSKELNKVFASLEDYRNIFKKKS